MAENYTTGYLLGRIRKAIVAGAAAGLAADVALVFTPTGMLSDGKIDVTEAGTLVGTFFTAGIAAGYLAWQTPNAASRHDNEDVATAAAITQVDALAIPAPRDAEVIRSAVSSVDFPPTPADPNQGRHEA